MTIPRFIKNTLVLFSIIVSPSCSSKKSYEENIIEQSVLLQGNSLRFVRKTWGITGNHTSLYLLEQLPASRIDTIMVQDGNNCSFYKMSGDTLVVYTPDVKQSLIQERKGIFIKQVQVDNPFMMNLIIGNNFKKKGLNKI